MALKNLSQSRGKWLVDGEKKDCWVGADSFKLANLLSQFYATGDQKYETMAKRWIEHMQGILGQNTHLRVFGETGGWEKGHRKSRVGHPMFGSMPSDAGIWDIADLRNRAANGQRIKKLTPLNESVIWWLLNCSHETGVAIEYVVDATIKHTEGLVTATTDHAIRETSEFMRALYRGETKGGREALPNAKIIIGARNEWEAHNGVGDEKPRTSLREVNMWAERFHRWELGEEKNYIYSYSDPGNGYGGRQWMEGFIIVDDSNNGVNVGKSPKNFDEMNEHPQRGDRWWELPPEYMERFNADARGVPTSFNESMMICDPPDESRCREWYGAGGWTVETDHYEQFLDNATGPKGVARFTVHAEKFVQCDTEWPRRETWIEGMLRERYGSGSPDPGPAPPDPPTPPEPPRVSYRRVIRQAYRDILDREPDNEGEASYQDKLENQGWTEARMREHIMRSAEFAKKNRG